MAALMIAMCVLAGLAMAATRLARGPVVPSGAARGGATPATGRTPLPPTRPLQAMSVAGGGGGAASLWRLATANPHCPLRRMFGTQLLTSSSDSPNELPRCTRMDCDCRYERVRDQRRELRRSGGERRELYRLDDRRDDRRQHGDRRIANRLWATGAAL